MLGSIRTDYLFVWISLLAGLGLLAAYAAPPPPDQARLRQSARQLRSQGNFKDALEIFRQLAASSSTAAATIHEDLRDAIDCQRNLGHHSELDDLLRQATEAHPRNFRLLTEAANALLYAPHYGVIRANRFERAPRNNDTGAWVTVQEQDRLRALQLLERAMEAIEGETDRNQQSRFYAILVDTLLQDRNGQLSWRLQHKTDLSQAPSYNEIPLDAAQPATRYAPVDARGGPVLYEQPDSWNAAASDGQRYRWAIERWSHLQFTEAKLNWADFLNGQFGVETLANDAHFFRFQAQADDENDERLKARTSLYALHTLDDSETLARLSSGIQRFKLPDEFNPIRIYQQLIERSPTGTDPYHRLINLYTNRRQYSRAAEVCRQAIAARTQQTESFISLLHQIIHPRGRFDSVTAQPAGKPATIGYVFRNANQANFTAARVDTERLLTDIKQFYRTHRSDQPPQFAGKPIYPPEVVDPSALFNQVKIDRYIQNEVAKWSLDLTPRENHWDRRVEVATPLQKPGLYVVTARVEKPDHIARCLVWIHDTSIVRKQLDNKILYYVADAISGRPIANAQLEFFGFSHQHENGRPRGVKVVNFAKKADANGQVIVEAKEVPINHQWQVTARASDGRFATLGMEHLWYAVMGQQETTSRKAYGLSDRPAYRPGDTIKAKFWVAIARYSGQSTIEDAGTPQLGQIPVKLVDPQGTSIWNGMLETDEWGGANVEVVIPKDTKLGLYHFQVDHGNVPTNLMVRIEEYRKPEFEIFIDSPTEPIQLGDKFTAKVRAKYYFGSPVAGATANVKVTRTAFRDQYFPAHPFDWCYGPGYWWTSYDWDWHPTWQRWRGCLQPIDWWLPRNRTEPPELVLEKEVTLDAAGEAMIEIDSSLAKAFQGDLDHRYRIEVDVRDASRRTLHSSGEVIAARQPFKIYAWCHRGYYDSGDKIVAHFQSRTLAGKPVKAQGRLELLRLAYDANREPVETPVEGWDVATDSEGNLEHTMQAGRAGQYRLRLVLTDSANHSIEGGHIITIRGNGPQANEFRFSALEIVPDRTEYRVGQTAKLQINADRDDALVWIFIRPQNSIYPAPRALQLQAKSSVIEIPIEAGDQPNFFIEAFTIYDGRFHQEAREIIVPPEDRVLNVKVETSQEEYLPGEEAELQISVQDPSGESVEGSAVVAVYDRSLDQIASDALPPDIREFFWKWRRSHHPQSIENLSRRTYPIYIEKMPSADPLGIFGHTVADDSELLELGLSSNRRLSQRGRFRGGALGGAGNVDAMFQVQERDGSAMSRAMPMAAAPMSAVAENAAMDKVSATPSADGSGPGGDVNAPPTVRKDFADAAYWIANLRFERTGKATTKFKMPENLTSWRIGVWSMGRNVRVGSGQTTAVTRKHLMVRLQAPRFLVDRDEVILSALVNNDFDEAIDAQVELRIEGDQLQFLDASTARQTVRIAAAGQQRVDWRCRAIKPGEVTLRTLAVSNRESDAMESKLPIIVNGVLKTESFAGTIRPEASSSMIEFQVPEARLADQSRLTIRMSPSLALAMTDALPYLVDYPYGCTEQTLNRFVPTIITHQTLVRLGIDLKTIQDRRSNLNAQEIGPAADRAKQWKRWDRHPVFDNNEVHQLVETGLRKITEMQNADGGWGWFSGLGERSWPHTTAVVVRGLLAAQQADAAIVPDCLNRGLDWLARYQEEQLRLLNEPDDKKRIRKPRPDDIDAFVFHVLVQANRSSEAMRSHLYEKRQDLSVHSKALLALATHKLGQAEQTDMLRRNVEQFLVEDAENETAYLEDQSPWWCWYGSRIEATATYLKLLAQMDAKHRTTSRLVKYLLNQRKHATYWNSTRDTAIVVEAFADYLAATGEGTNEMEVEAILDGQSIGKVQFSPTSLFESDNTIELIGEAIRAGDHRLELRRTGGGALYWNVFHTNFTLESEIAAAGLEVKIERRYYRLQAKQKELLMASDRGQIGIGQAAAYDRIPLEDGQEVTSGELIEVELLVESKNDYEYLIVSDRKAASFEPIDTASGYDFGDRLQVYREFRDQHVALFLRSLPRGSHSLRYQLRCEAPGRFTALPATITGMYAPELVGNSRDYDAQVVE